MSDELNKLRNLYGACRNTPAVLLPNRIREAMIQCAANFGDDPVHSEDDPTPESLLIQAAEHIKGLLENLGHWDADGLESMEEWRQAEQLANTIAESFPHNNASAGS